VPNIPLSLGWVGLRPSQTRFVKLMDGLMSIFSLSLSLFFINMLDLAWLYGLCLSPAHVNLVIKLITYVECELFHILYACCNTRLKDKGEGKLPRLEGMLLAGGALVVVW
jgi:hypothetical protein